MRPRRLTLQYYERIRLEFFGDEYEIPVPPRCGFSSWSLLLFENSRWWLVVVGLTVACLCELHSECVTVFFGTTRTKDQTCVVVVILSHLFFEFALQYLFVVAASISLFTILLNCRWLFELNSSSQTKSHHVQAFFNCHLFAQFDPPCRFVRLDGGP